MRQIGITGAFGLLGSNLIAAILDKKKRGDPEWGDTRIIAFASNTASNPLFSNEEVEVRFLDVLDYEDVVRNFYGLDAVVHFAGKIDDVGNSRQKIWDTNVAGTKNVFDAASARDVGRLLYASSICALGRSLDGHAADEDSRPYGDPLWPVSFSSGREALASALSPNGVSPAFLDGSKAIYFDSKLAALELAGHYFQKLGLPVITIFPGTVVGKGDLHDNISKLIDRVWRGALAFTFEGGSSFVTADDFSAGALLALSRGRPGEGYVLAGGDELNLKYAEFQRRVAQASGRPRGEILELPIVVPRELALGVCHIASFMLPRTSLTPGFAFSGSVDNFCTTAKAKGELGYAPKNELGDAIVQCRRFSEDFHGTRPRRRAPKLSLVFDRP